MSRRFVPRLDSLESRRLLTTAADAISAVEGVASQRQAEIDTNYAHGLMSEYGAAVELALVWSTDDAEVEAIEGIEGESPCPPAPHPTEPGDPEPVDPEDPDGGTGPEPPDGDGTPPYDPPSTPGGPDGPAYAYYQNISSNESMEISAEVGMFANIQAGHVTMSAGLGYIAGYQASATTNIDAIEATAGTTATTDMDLFVVGGIDPWAPTEKVLTFYDNGEPEFG